MRLERREHFFTQRDLATLAGLQRADQTPDGILPDRDRFRRFWVLSPRVRRVDLL